MQHNEPTNEKEEGIVITASIREKADALYEQLKTMDNVPALLAALRTLRLAILSENSKAHIDADFIHRALKLSGLDGKSISTNNARTLQHICYALADKIGLIAETSHKLMVEDFGSINSLAENLLEVVSIDGNEKEDDGLQYGDEQLAIFIDRFANDINKALSPQLNELEEKRAAYLDKLNQLFEQLKAYNSSVRIKTSNSLRIKPKMIGAFTKKEELEKTIMHLSKEIWLGPETNTVYGPLAETEREFFYQLMRQYDNFFSRSKQYELREALSVSPFFRLETLRFDALKLIKQKIKAIGQKENKQMLEIARDSIANANNIKAVVVKLEELKNQYQPRKGFFKVNHLAKSMVSDKKMSGMQTKFYQSIAELLIKYRHLESKGRELKPEGREKEPEGRSPSPSRRF